MQAHQVGASTAHAVLNLCPHRSKFSPYICSRKKQCVSTFDEKC
nr:MAG TPA: hypothetical protein [Caudoviricetes sp.]